MIGTLLNPEFDQQQDDLQSASQLAIPLSSPPPKVKPSSSPLKSLVKQESMEAKIGGPFPPSATKISKSQSQSSLPQSQQTPAHDKEKRHRQKVSGSFATPAPPMVQDTPDSNKKHKKHKSSKVE